MSYLSRFIYDSADVDIQSHIESLGSDLVVYPSGNDEVHFYFNPHYVPSSNKLHSDVHINPYGFSYFDRVSGTGREDWTRLRRPTESEIRHFVWRLEKLLEDHRTRVLPIGERQAELVRGILGSVVK